MWSRPSSNGTLKSESAIKVENIKIEKDVNITLDNIS